MSGSSSRNDYDDGQSTNILGRRGVLGAIIYSQESSPGPDSPVTESPSLKDSSGVKDLGWLIPAVIVGIFILLGLAFACFLIIRRLELCVLRWCRVCCCDQDEENRRLLTGESYDAMSQTNRRETVRLTDEEDNVNLADEEDNVNLADEEDNVNLADEEDNVNLADEEDNVNLADEEDNVNLADEEDNVNLADEEDNVNLADEEDNVNLADEEDNVNLADEEDNVNLADEEDNVNLADEEDNVKHQKNEEISVRRLWFTARPRTRDTMTTSLARGLTPLTTTDQVAAA